MLLPIDVHDMFVFPFGSVFILFLILHDNGFGVNGEDLKFKSAEATDIMRTLYNLIAKYFSLVFAYSLYNKLGYLLKEVAEAIESWRIERIETRKVQHGRQYLLCIFG